MRVENAGAAAMAVKLGPGPSYLVGGWKEGKAGRHRQVFLTSHANSLESILQPHTWQV